MTYVHVIGNVTADPEIRFTQNGVPVVSFSVAENNRRFDATTKQWTDGEPVFWSVTVWRDLAENLTESVRRGTRVVVVGEIKEREFTTKDGENKRVKEIEATDVGVSLRFATANVTKTHRANGQHDRPHAAAAAAPTGTSDADLPF